MLFRSFKRAAAPYTLAIQIAANLANYWLPTDDWECKFTLPLAPSNTSISASPPVPPPPPSRAVPNGLQTLHSIIQQSMANNASSPSTSQRSDGPAGEAESISMLGQLSRSAPAPQTVIQTRFQGLWWGTERIWTDELVRLKIARCQFAPNGTDVIAPPAGPSARTLERMKEYEGVASVDPVRLGSSERGLFLRLEGLFIVDVPTQDGSNVTKECRASGMVYELVDEDWEDPDASTENDTSGLDKGKGKARELPDGGGCNACSSPLISDM